MKARRALRVARSLLVSFGACALLACGGDRPAERPSEPAAEVPAAAPAETPAPNPPAPTPPESSVTPATSTPAAAPAVVPSAPKPAPKQPPSGAPVAETPKAEPKPEPVVMTLAVGTEFDAELLDAASSKTSKVGESVRARVIHAVDVDGVTVVPAGAIIAGTITEATPLKKIGGQASLGVKFDTLELPGGQRTPIVAGLQAKGKSETGKDAGTIAGATAGGALLGRLFSKHDKTKGTLIGAVVGAAAGTGAAAATKGQEVDLPAGTPLTLHLEEAVQVTVQP